MTLPASLAEEVTFPWIFLLILINKNLSVDEGRIPSVTWAIRVVEGTFENSWKSKYFCDEGSNFSAFCQSVPIIQLLRAIFFLWLESRQTATHCRLLKEGNIFNNIVPGRDAAYNKVFIDDVNNNNFKQLHEA
jgi:hypothetical protein